MNSVSGPIFNEFPEEIVRMIFLKLKRKDVAICSRVCKLWQNVLSDDFYWKQFAIRERFNTLEIVPVKYEGFFSIANWLKSLHKTKSSVKEILRHLVLNSNEELKAIYDPVLVDALGGFEDLRSFPVIQKAKDIHYEELKGPITRGFDGSGYFLVFRYRDRKLNKNYFEIWNKLPVGGGFIHWRYSSDRHYKENRLPVAHVPYIGSLLEQYRWNVDEIVLDRLKRLVQKKHVGVPSTDYNNLQNIEVLQEVDATMEDGQSRIVLI